MSERSVVVVKTGTANLASVLAAFERLGVTAHLSNSPTDILSAERVVLPGVGAFAAAMEELTKHGLDAALRERVRQGNSTLGICLGMQLFCTESEESPGTTGLGFVPGTARRFPDTVRVPQFGWNEVVPRGDSAFLQSGYAYFANSYRLPFDPDAPPAGWKVSLSHHGGAFVACLEKGRVLGCQFHPELSGSWGKELLNRWMGGQETC